MFFLVSHKYKFLMGWSAKCACSSVKHWYLEAHGIDIAELGMPVFKAIGYTKTQYTKVEWDKPELYSDYRKYAVVRNPYSRVASGFVNKYIIENRLPNRGWSTFNQFLQILSEDTEFRTVDTHHFTPQFSEAYRGFERAGFEFDLVIQIENLESGLRSICAKHHINGIPIKSVNETKYGKLLQSYTNAADILIDRFDKENIPPFQCFYDASSIERVRNIYSKDFERLEDLGICYQPPEV